MSKEPIMMFVMVAHTLKKTTTIEIPRIVLWMTSEFTEINKFLLVLSVELKFIT